MKTGEVGPHKRGALWVLRLPIAMALIVVGFIACSIKFIVQSTRGIEEAPLFAGSIRDVKYLARSWIRTIIRHKGRALWVLRLLIVAMFVAIGFWCFGQRTQTVFDGGAVRSVRNHLFVVPLKIKGPFLEMGNDSNDHPAASKARLYEGDIELGPAHSLHEDIATLGRGRYSHWQDKLYFSASDNSDPRTNGRRYSLTYRLYLQPWIPTLLALASAIGILILRGWRIDEDPLLRSTVRAVRQTARLFANIIVRHKGGALWVLRLVIVATFATTGFWIFGQRTATVFDRGTVSFVSGHLFVVPLKINGPFLEMGNDSNDHPTASKARLYEGDAELGSPHSLHENISALGRGRYSHWQDKLYFSASDNSDPRTNGRRYTLIYRLYLRSWIPALLASASAIGLLILGAWRVEVDPLIGRSVLALNYLGRRLIPLFIAGVGAIAAFIAVLMLSSTFAGLMLGHADPVTEIFRWSSELRAIGYIEPYFPYLVLTGGLLGAIHTWVNRVRGKISKTHFQLELNVTRTLCYLGLPLLMGALLLILASEKSGAALQFNPNDLSIGGYIPFNDANGHWICPMQQAITGHWMPFCNRRPLASALRAIFEFVGVYDYDFAQLVQAASIAGGLYIAVVAIAIWAGGWSAMAFVAIALIGIRAFLPTTLTAPLGFFLGSLALAAFALSLVRKSIVLNTVAVFFLTFALFVRMGSMFSIPAVVVWSFWRFRGSRPQMMAAGGAAILAVLIVIAASQAVATFYGAGKNALGSNFSYSLAGLSLGVNWQTAERTYSHEINIAHSEKEAASFLYKKAIHNIITKPTVFLNRLMEGEAYFWQHVLRTMLYGYLPIHEGFTGRMTRIILSVLLTGLGLMLLYRLPHREDVFFIVLFVSSVAASVPFIMFDDGWRALMATTPFAAAIFAFGLRSPQTEWTRKSLGSSFLPMKFALFSIVPVLVLAVIAGPWLFHRFQKQYRESLSRVSLSGPGDTNINTGFARTGFIVVADDAPIPVDAPAITESAFASVIQSSGIDSMYHRVLGQHVLPHPPYALFSTTNIDLASYGMQTYFFFGPPALIEGPTRGLYRVSYAPVPNALKNGVTIFYQIKQAIPLKVGPAQFEAPLRKVSAAGSRLFLAASAAAK